MKTALLIFTIFASTVAYSYECKQYEAQIIAKVSERLTDSLTYCVAKIDPASIVHYSENQLCPLDLSEVLSKGVAMPLQNGHDCEVNAGDTLTGILVQSPSGLITLE